MARAGSAVGIIDVRTVAIAEDIKFALDFNLAICVGKKLRYYSSALFGDRSQNSYITEDSNYDGFTGWVQAFSAALICAVVFGTLHSVVLLQRYFMLTLEIGEVEVIVIASAKYMIVLLFSPCSGAIIKCVGHRYACTIGLLLVAVQFFIDSIISQVGIFYLTQLLLAGVGYSLAFCAASSCVIDRFRKETLLGLLPVIIASSVGTILLLAFVYFLRHGSNLNSRWILVALGLLVLLTIALTRSLPHNPHPPKHPNPFATTSKSVKIGQCLESKQLTVPRDPCKGDDHEDKTFLCICVTDIGIIFTLVFILWSFISFVSMLTVYIPYLFLIWLAIDEFNVSPGDAVLLLIIFCIASILARILLNILDYTTFKSNRILFVVGLLGNGILYIFLPDANTHGWLIVWSVTVGVCEGILVVTTPRLTLRTVPRANIICAWTVIVISHGIALFIGAVIWASFRKLSGGDIIIPCLILGIFQIVAALLCFLLPDEEEEFAERNEGKDLQNPPFASGPAPPNPFPSSPFPFSGSGCNDCSEGYASLYSGNQGFSSFDQTCRESTFKFSSNFGDNKEQPCKICESMKGNLCPLHDGCNAQTLKTGGEATQDFSTFNKDTRNTTTLKYEQELDAKKRFKNNEYGSDLMPQLINKNYLVPAIVSNPNLNSTTRNHYSPDSPNELHNNLIPNVRSDPTIGGPQATKAKYNQYQTSHNTNKNYKSEEQRRKTSNQKQDELRHLSENSDYLGDNSSQQFNGMTENFTPNFASSGGFGFQPTSTSAPRDNVTRNQRPSDNYNPNITPGSEFSGSTSNSYRHRLSSLTESDNTNQRNSNNMKGRSFGFQSNPEKTKKFPEQNRFADSEEENESIDSTQNTKFHGKVLTNSINPNSMKGRSFGPASSQQNINFGDDSSDIDNENLERRKMHTFVHSEKERRSSVTEDKKKHELFQEPVFYHQNTKHADSEDEKESADSAKNTRLFKSKRNLHMPSPRIGSIKPTSSKDRAKIFSEQNMDFGNESSNIDSEDLDRPVVHFQKEKSIFKEDKGKHDDPYGLPTNNTRNSGKPNPRLGPVQSKERVDIFSEQNIHFGNDSNNTDSQISVRPKLPQVVSSEKGKKSIDMKNKKPEAFSIFTEQKINFVNISNDIDSEILDRLKLDRKRSYDMEDKKKHEFAHGSLSLDSMNNARVFESNKSSGILIPRVKIFSEQNIHYGNDSSASESELSNTNTKIKGFRSGNVDGKTTKKNQEKFSYQNISFTSSDEDNGFPNKMKPTEKETTGNTFLSESEDEKKPSRAKPKAVSFSTEYSNHLEKDVLYTTTFSTVQENMDEIVPSIPINTGNRNPSSRRSSKDRRNYDAFGTLLNRDEF